MLDWRFLTTEGDPAFDAAVAASNFDMYGPEALKARPLAGAAARP
ncbi:hypothetical protein [Phytohabitans aurantiacus]|nr:hypothetical protein [Phytohabitans aurantiacus]